MITNSSWFDCKLLYLSTYKVIYFQEFGQRIMGGESLKFMGMASWQFPAGNQDRVYVEILSLKSMRRSMGLKPRLNFCVIVLN